VRDLEALDRRVAAIWEATRQVWARDPSSPPPQLNWHPQRGWTIKSHWRGTLRFPLRPRSRGLPRAAAYRQRSRVPRRRRRVRTAAPKGGADPPGASKRKRRQAPNRAAIKATPNSASFLSRLTSALQVGAEPGRHLAADVVLARARSSWRVIAIHCRLCRRSADARHSMSVGKLPWRSYRTCGPARMQPNPSSSAQSTFGSTPRGLC
jgi:hypothetical protein